MAKQRILLIAAEVLLGISLFAFVFPVFSKVWASSLSLNPASGNIESGKDLVVDVVVSGQNEIVDGVDVELSYDTNFLKVKNISNGPFFSTYPIKKDNNGQVLITALAPKDGAKLFGDIVVSTVTFEILDSGNTKVGIVFEKGKTSESNIAQHGTAADILSSVQGGSYSVVASPGNLRAAQAKKASGLSPLPFFIIFLILIGAGIWYYLKKRKPKEDVYVPEAFPMDQPPKADI